MHVVATDYFKCLTASFQKESFKPQFLFKTIFWNIANTSKICVSKLWKNFSSFLNYVGTMAHCIIIIVYMCIHITLLYA